MTRVSTIKESHSPIGKKDYLSVQHIERYRFAASRLSYEMKVLDIACGSGYGTALLSKHGFNVIAGDYDEASVFSARQIWQHRNIVKANALRLPFSNESFDAVVSYETIEHVLDGRDFLLEMHRVLLPGGIFICSTPNICYTFHPRYHVKEYEAEEFFKLMGSVFPNVNRYGQYFRPIDRFRDLYSRNLLHPALGKLGSHLLPLFERIGIKSAIAKLILGNHFEYSRSKIDFCPQDWLDKVLTGEEDRKYKVKPFSGDKWARIMIAVAKKEI